MDYLLRNIDEEQWKKFKAICEKEGRPMKWYFINVIEDVVYGKQ